MGGVRRNVSGSRRLLTGGGAARRSTCPVVWTGATEPGPPAVHRPSLPRGGGAPPSCAAGLRWRASQSALIPQSRDVARGGASCVPVAPSATGTRQAPVVHAVSRSGKGPHERARPVVQGRDREAGPACPDQRGHRGPTSSVPRRRDPAAAGCGPSPGMQPPVVRHSLAPNPSSLAPTSHFVGLPVNTITRFVYAPSHL